jgi:HSP20 family protein
MSKNGEHSVPRWLTTIVAILVLLVGIQGVFLYRLHRDYVAAKLLQPDGEGFPASNSTPSSNTSIIPKGGISLSVDSFFQDQDWDPFREIQQMREQMDRFFEDTLNHFGPGSARTSWFDLEWSGIPRVDMQETEDAYDITVELPGADASTIKTNIKSQTLQITAAIDQQSETSSEEKSIGKILRRERWVSHFERKLHFEDPVEADRMTTHFEDGILEIHLPKSKATS